MSILEEAKKVIRIEAEALLRLADALDGEFERAVELILASKGRVVVTGMGKSGLIGAKIASTMAIYRYACFLPPSGRGHCAATSE